MRFTIFAAMFAFLLWGTPAFAGSNPDFDADGVGDTLDNCSREPNAQQDDTDGDFCGNLCDCDYDQDGICGLLDFGRFTGAYLTVSPLNCHTEPIGGVVGLLDFGFFGAHYLTVPGPSGTTPGTIACP